MKNLFNKYWIHILVVLLMIETIMLNFKYDNLEQKHNNLLESSKELSKQSELLSVENEKFLKDIKIYEDVIDTLNKELLRCSKTCHEFVPLNEQVEE